MRLLLGLCVCVVSWLVVKTEHKAQEAIHSQVLGVHHLNCGNKSRTQNIYTTGVVTDQKSSNVDVRPLVSRYPHLQLALWPLTFVVSLTSVTWCAYNTVWALRRCCLW